MKTCSECKIIKDNCDYHKNKKSPDGLDYRCKECKEQIGKKYREDNKKEIAIAGKEYYEKNKNQINGQQRERYQSHKEEKAEYRALHKEDISEYNKQYREENREKLLEYSRQYYQDNKEILTIANKNWTQNHKEEILVYKNEWEKNRRENDITFVLRKNISCSVRYALNNIGLSKNGSATWKHLYYSPEDLKEYLGSPTPTVGSPRPTMTRHQSCWTAGRFSGAVRISKRTCRNSVWWRATR